MSDVNNGAAADVSFEHFEAAMNEGRDPFAKNEEKESAESTRKTGRSAKANADAEGGEEDGTAEESATSEEHSQEEHDGEEQGNGKKAQSKLEKRFSRLTRTIRELEQKSKADAEDAARWREQQKGGTKTETAKAEAASDKEPEPGEPGHENETVAQYNKRLVKWQLAQERQAAAKADAEKSAKARQDEATKVWEAKKDAARDEFDDFDEALEDFKGAVTRTMSEFLMDSEVGGHVAYYLATHPQEAAKIAEMGPARAAKALTTIEAQFAKDKDSSDAGDEEEEKPAKRTSAAPPPTRPLKKSSPAKSSDPMALAKDGDYQAFEKLMNKRQYGR